MKKLNLCVGVNGAFEEIRDLVNTFSQIGSIYTSDYVKKTAGGRNVSYLKSLDQIREIATFLREHRVEYYVANNHTVFTRPRSDRAFWGDYREHILGLQESGVTGIITGHPFFVEFIKKHSKLKVCVSTTAEVATGRAARHFEEMGADMICPSYSVNYDMERLLEIRRSLKTATIKLLANEMCLGDCPHRKYHQNAYFSEHNLDEDYGYVCHHTMMASPVEMLQNNTIRPEDVGNYTEVADTIKLSLRQPPFYDTAKNKEVVRAYCEGRHDGNYIDLVSQRLAQFINIPNSGLDGLYEIKSKCKKNCQSCKLCHRLYESATAGFKAA
jgi:collagenase-like PrtC family protease